MASVIFEQARACFCLPNIFFTARASGENHKKNTQAEQQAMAKYGLDFVTDKYLPEKLTELGVI